MKRVQEKICSLLVLNFGNDMKCNNLRCCATSNLIQDINIKCGTYFQALLHPKMTGQMIVYHWHLSIFVNDTLKIYNDNVIGSKCDQYCNR